jgi:hypothetical protein
VSAEYISSGTTILADNTLGPAVKFRVYPEPDPITEILPSPQIIFYPTNEGEKATYNFTLDLKQLTNFWEDDRIWIRFPSRYDINLGKVQIQVMSNELKGGLHIEVNNLEVIISGFDPGRIPNTVTLSLYGITNPNNIANTPIIGFELAVLNRLNMTRAMTEYFGELYVTDAPEIIEIISMEHKI